MLLVFTLARGAGRQGGQQPVTQVGVYVALSCMGGKRDAEKGTDLRTGENTGRTWGLLYDRITVHKQDSHLGNFTESKTYTLRCNELVDLLPETNLSINMSHTCYVVNSHQRQKKGRRNHWHFDTD